MATDVNQAKLSLEKFFKTRHFSRCGFSCAGKTRTIKY